MHAVHQLYLYRKSLSRREFKARGWKLKRCPQCRICVDSCICELVQQNDSNAAFLLLMYDNEVLKPSNTGRLIADVIKDTHAYLWHRTQLHPELETLLNSNKYQPFVVFPKEYAADEQVVFEQKPAVDDKFSVKPPLFILIDATWRQAKKIFRKSPYLMSLPMVSIPAHMMVGGKLDSLESSTKNNLHNTSLNNIEDSSEQYAIVQKQAQLSHGNFDSKYQVRKAEKEGQFATAEVAAKVLNLFEHQHAAKHLDLWFDVFAYRYQQGVKQKNKGNPLAVAHYLEFLNKSAT